MMKGCASVSRLAAYKLMKWYFNIFAVFIYIFELSSIYLIFKLMNEKSKSKEDEFFDFDQFEANDEQNNIGNEEIFKSFDFSSGSIFGAEDDPEH